MNSLAGRRCAPGVQKRKMINITNLLRSYRKRRTIKSYLTRIGPLLAKRYGKAERYTPKQVEETAREAGLPMHDLCYALSVYCNRDAFDAYHAESGEDCNYWQMRAEVAEHYFHGNVAFTPQDVSEVTASHSHSGGNHFGGHDHGGDSGHHH